MAIANRPQQYRGLGGIRTNRILNGGLAGSNFPLSIRDMFLGFVGLLEGLVFCSGNDLVLECLAEVAEVIAVTCHSNDQVPIFLRVCLCCT